MSMLLAGSVRCVSGITINNGRDLLHDADNDSIDDIASMLIIAILRLLSFIIPLDLIDRSSENRRLNLYRLGSEVGIETEFIA